MTRTRMHQPASTPCLPPHSRHLQWPTSGPAGTCWCLTCCVLRSTTPSAKATPCSPCRLAAAHLTAMAVTLTPVPLHAGRWVRGSGPAAPFDRAQRLYAMLAVFTVSGLMHEALFWWARFCER